jgi:uroporphyrinogen-III synthase
MLLTNQKTINYENLLTPMRGYDFLIFASANVVSFVAELQLKN